MEFFKGDKIYNFMGKRGLFITISLFMIIGSFISIGLRGFNWGIDFIGGVEVQVRFIKPVPIAQIRKAVEKEYRNASITNFGSAQEFLIRLSVKNSSTNLTNDIGDKISTLLKPIGSVEVRRVNIVGAKVGNELKEKGIKAFLVAMVGILLYVAFRFEWRFAVASVLALFHDTIISLGAVTLFQVEFNLDLLAAILTLMGYSLNDTIVVFDRIREQVALSKGGKLESHINEAVSKTLSRTVLTSLTTFFVVFTLFLFGGEIIRPFAFPLLVGIVVGTYSSIFIASPLLIWLRFNVDKYRQKLIEKRKKQEERERLRKMYEGGVI